MSPYGGTVENLCEALAYRPHRILWQSVAWEKILRGDLAVWSGDVRP